MKFLMAVVVALITRSAVASEVLNCQRRSGPGDLVVTIVDGSDRSVLVTIVLTSPSFPNGTTGHYAGSIDPKTQSLRATGTIADLSADQSNILIGRNAKSVGLGLWADGDERIESGFGAWFVCN